MKAENKPSKILVLDYLLIVSVSISLMLVSFNSKSDEESKKEVKPEFIYSELSDAEMAVDLTLAKAKKENKLALVVLGAQWCHDSRGLAEKFSEPELYSILQERFETIFIDVGNYKDKRYITQKLGYPFYFATPTVLVVNPHTSTLINEDTLTIWQSAYSVDFEEYLEYFSSIGAQTLSTTDKTLLDNHPQLNEFTQTQTDRLMQAYTKISPLMAAHSAKTLEDKTEFYALWDEVKAFRSQLQKDLHKLRKQVSESPQVVLTFPTYERFSWES